MNLSPINVKETDRLISLLHSKMKEENDFHEKLIRHSDIGMVILDRKTSQFVFANPSAERIYNRSFAELSQLTLKDVTDIEFTQHIEKGFEKLDLDELKSYKMAKVYIIPPDNIRKIAFLELVEIATDIKFPYILGILIEKSQIDSWSLLVNSIP